MGNDHNCSWAYVGLCTPPYWLSCPCPSVNEPVKWLLYWSLCQSPGVLKLGPLAEMERRKKCFSLTLCGKTWEDAGEIWSEVQKLLKTVGKKINTVARKRLFSTWQRNWNSLFISITMGQKTMCCMRFAKFLIWRCEMKTVQIFNSCKEREKMFLGYAFLPFLPNFSLSSLLGMCVLEKSVVWNECFSLLPVICSQIRTWFLNVTVEHSGMFSGGTGNVFVIPQMWLWAFPNVQQYKIACTWWEGGLIFRGGGWGVFCWFPPVPLWLAHQSTEDVYIEC